MNTRIMPRFSTLSTDFSTGSRILWVQPGQRALARERVRAREGVNPTTTTTTLDGGWS